MVKCEVCGATDEDIILPHIRDEHDVEEYLEEYPDADLISKKFGKLLGSVRPVFDDSGEMIKIQREVLGLDFETPVEPHELVPEFDENYVIRPEIALQVLAGIKNKDNILMVGPTGCGKSSMVVQLASILNFPVIRVAAYGGIVEEDLLGEWTVQKGETVFNYGFIPKAMKLGAICLVDEFDSIEPSVAFAIHQVMEDEGQLVLLRNGGEIIHPHEDFRLIATANTLGYGDDAGLYTGTKVLNEACLDRFKTVMSVDYPDSVLENKIIRNRVPQCDRSTASDFIKAAKSLRKARESEEINSTMSTRKLINLVEKFYAFNDLKMALEVSVLNRLPTEEAYVIKEFFERVFGSESVDSGLSPEELQETRSQ